MPPKRKRSAIGGLFRSFKRRRVHFGGGGRRVAAGIFARSRGKRFPQRRTLTSKSKRRNFRRRFTRRRPGTRRSRSGRKISPRAIINALQPWQAFTAEYGQEHNVPAVSATGVRPCVYFTPEFYVSNASIDSVPTVCLYDYTHIGTVANIVWKNTVTNSFGVVPTSTTLATSSKMRILIRGHQVSTIRNQTNEPVVIECWVLKPRGNTPTFNTGAGFSNLYQKLSFGFANNSLDAGNTNASVNITMKDSNYHPYNSWDLCRDFIIKPLKSRVLSPTQMAVYKLKGKSMLFRPADVWSLSGSSSNSNWDSPQSTRRFEILKQQRYLLFRLRGNPAGFGGAAQSTYAKLIQMTTPTVIMDTRFKYEAKAIHQMPTPSTFITHSGITTNGAVPPAIVVPDGDVIGAESEAP